MVEVSDTSVKIPSNCSEGKFYFYLSHLKAKIIPTHEAIIRQNNRQTAEPTEPTCLAEYSLVTEQVGASRICARNLLPN